MKMNMQIFLFIIFSLIIYSQTETETPKYLCRASDAGKLKLVNTTYM